MRRRGVAAAIALVALVLVLIVVTDDPDAVLDADDAAARIARVVQDGTRLDVQISCPEGIDAQPGATFSCTGRSGRDRVAVDVRLEGDGTRFRVTAVRPG